MRPATTTAAVLLSLASAACSRNPEPASAAPSPAVSATTPATAPVQPAPAAAPDLSGDWTFTVELGGQTMVGSMSLTRSGSNYSGTAAPEGASSATLASLEISGRRVRMVFDTPDGFQALLELALEGISRLTGSLSYGGQTGTFTATRR